VRRVCVVSVRGSAHSAGAVAARRQNIVSVPLRASDQGMLRLTRTRGWLSFWEPASYTYRNTAWGSAKNDMLGVHWEQRDAQTHTKHLQSQNEMPCVRVAQISLKRPSLGKS